MTVAASKLPARRKQAEYSMLVGEKGVLVVGPPFGVKQTASGLLLFGTDGSSHWFWHCSLFLCVPGAVGRRLFKSEAVYCAILAILYFQHFVNARSKRNCN